MELDSLIDRIPANTANANPDSAAVLNPTGLAEAAAIRHIIISILID